LSRTIKITVPGPAPRKAYAGFRESIACFGIPGAGKTQFMARTAMSAPGAAFISSSNPDLANLTAAARADTGAPVYWLNPSGAGGFPSNIGFSPLAGCQDPRMAMESAGALIAAAPHDTSGKDAHWDHQSKDMLQFLLHAAALTPRADIIQVRDWASDPVWAGKAAVALEQRGAPGWANRLIGMVAAGIGDEKHWHAISSGVLTALAWLDDPALAELACPPPGMEFNVREFLRQKGTAYAIGSDSEHNPQAPYFSCLTTHLWAEAKRAAADPDEPASSGLRLDPPLVMVIDEPNNGCRVALDKWPTEAGGRGVCLVTGFQSDAQPAQGWGEHGGAVMLDAFTVTLVFGGAAGPLASAVSKAVGDHDTYDKGNAGKIHGVRPTYPPERVRAIPDGVALVLHRNTKAFEVDMLPAAAHPRYRPVTPGMFPARIPQEQPAVEAAPRRDAIPVPAAAITAGPALIPICQEASN
jgi:type IV secretion system protein VirD4